MPEYLPKLLFRFSPARCLIFIQNWPLIYRHVNAHVGSEDLAGSYSEMGYELVMSCTNLMAQMLTREPEDKVLVIPNYIDLEVFYPSPSKRRKARVLAMPRKNKQDLVAIVDKVSARMPLDIVYADGLTELQLAEEYRKSDIYLATGYPEGFGLPPLEAMACGCAVVGFTGKGAREFMIHEETALVCDDGDTDTAAELLIRLLTDGELRERLRSTGTTIANCYTQDKTAGQLKVLCEKMGVRAKTKL